MSHSVFNPAVADLNCSGTIDFSDTLIIARYGAGLLARLPCQNAVLRKQSRYALAAKGLYEYFFDG